jgi:hypothetical protein
MAKKASSVALDLKTPESRVTGLLKVSTKQSTEFDSGIAGLAGTGVKETAAATGIRQEFGDYLNARPAQTNQTQSTP